MSTAGGGGIEPGRLLHGDLKSFIEAYRREQIDKVDLDDFRFDQHATRPSPGWIRPDG